MIINSRSRVSNLLFSSSCINWLYATLATPGLLASVRNASLCVRRAGMPIASPSSRARSSDTIGTRAAIASLPLRFDDCATGRAGGEGAGATVEGTLAHRVPVLPRDRRTHFGDVRALGGRRHQVA